MLPFFFRQNLLYGGKWYAHFLGHTSNTKPGVIHIYNQSNCGFRVFMVPIFFSKTMSFFINHIFRVIFRSPNKKMIGVYAFSVIARMANKHFFRNNAFMKNPRIPMGMNMLFANLNLTIPINTYCSFPYPARICFFNMTKKNSLNIPSATRALSPIYRYWLFACSAFSIADNFFSTCSIVEGEFCGY